MATFYARLRSFVNRKSAVVDTPPDEQVRIFVFDRKQWFGNVVQVPKLAPAQPHVSLLDAFAIENLRMIPQQALSNDNEH